MNYYEFWSYHDSPVDPVAPTTDKIFGLELEIDGINSMASEAIDNMIENEIIGAPYNEGYSSVNVQIENDSSVYCELIFCANHPEKILDALATLNENGLNPETVPNCRNGTSAHISISNDYLEVKGVTVHSLNKIMELYSPVLYAVSERSKNDARRWAQPQAYDLEFVDWFEKILKVQNVCTNDSHGGRYTLLNCESSYKSELRILSNNNGGFDYNRIAFYLDLVDFIIDQAETMQGKLYKNEYKRLLSELEDFIRTNYYEYYFKYGLYFVFHPLLSFTQLKQARFNCRRNIGNMEHRIQGLKDAPFSTCNHMGILKQCADQGYFREIGGITTADILKYAEKYIDFQYRTIKSYYLKFLRDNYSLLEKGGF